MQEPLFIVAPGRSFTSVIGGMIGQHPEIYGLPEMNLSHIETLGHMINMHKGPLEFAMAGLLRLLAEIHDGEQTEAAVLQARKWIMKRSHWTPRQTFNHIQDKVGDRLLLDKSPLNTIRIDHLQNIARMFPHASYLHLTRHPSTAGKSAMELRNTLRDGRQDDSDAEREKREQAPEKSWLRAQNNILEFSRELAVGQYMRVKAEMLLSDPKFYLSQICEWLGISNDDASLEAMMHPETSPFACIGPPSAKFGNDPNFLKNPKLDFDRLARIKEPPLSDGASWRDGAALSEPVLKLARQFGYG
ncbi:MAG: sulfotransferase [Rhodobacteraceae bacterium]|nr:sulfotransferase [Paracoccaceae bacterium]